MLTRNFIKRVSLTICCIALTNLLPAQALASLDSVKQAELDLSNTVRLLEQNILLALTVGVALLGIVWVVYVCNAHIQSKRLQQNDRNPLFTFALLIVGMGMFCSSCGIAQEVQATPSDNAQEQMQSGCPRHHATQEPLAFVNIYRGVGYPAQRSSTCKFCGQRLVNPRD